MSRTGPIPVNLITGFLGAGKTTAILQLLATRPAGERWAVLVNEFGRIGIDQAVFPAGEVAVKEVPGGCLCCANQLPMQIALGQLVSRTQPDRLLIEPTGLGHPRQILSALREPHWQQVLTVRATLTLVDARDLSDPRVTEHDTFQAQVAAADVLVFSKDDALTDTDRAAARAFADTLVPAKQHIAFVAEGRLDPAWLNLPSLSAPVRRSLLHRPPAAAPTPSPQLAPPCHYHERALGRELAGWLFPADWVFRHDALISVLYGLQGIERLKGVFHTEQGWIFVNLTARDALVKNQSAGTDSRVEVIASTALDWAGFEAAMLATRVD